MFIPLYLSFPFVEYFFVERLFLQLSEAQSTGLQRRRPLAEMAARWRCAFPIKNLTPDYNSQFCISFIFVFAQEAKNTSKHVYIGPKHNLVNFKSLQWCLFIKSWSSSHQMYAGKRCKGNPISTKR